MKKVSLFIVLLLPILYIVAFSEKTHFADISTHWAKSVIEQGAEEGILKGFPDGTFRPDQPVTEAEFMALLIRVFPNAQKESAVWSDNHSEGKWTDSVVEIANRYHLPLVSLVEPITRIQVAQVISGAEGFHYDDLGAIAYLYDLGLSHGRYAQSIVGYDGGGTLTRAEAASFILNLKEKGLTEEMKNRPFEQSYRASVGRYEEATLVALGDSISFGLGLNENQSKPSEQAFPSVMAADQGYQLMNLGIPGWTTKDLLKALETDKFKTVINKARIVTLEIGSNDLIQGSTGILAKLKKDPTYKPSDEEVFEQVILSEGSVYTDLPLIIDRIHQLTDAPIVLYTLYNPFPNSQGLEYIHQLNEQILYPIDQLITDTVRRDDKLLLADAHGAFSGKESTFVRVAFGDIHPTVQGQKELAMIGEEALRQTITRK